MITFALVNAGNYQGRGQRYVATIARQIHTHFKGPHNVVCFTDDPGLIIDGVEARDLPHRGLRGWFNKLALFKPGVFKGGERVVYLDLDTLVVGDITFLSGYRGRFAMLGPFSFESRINRLYRGAQSCIMAWEGGFGGGIWARFLMDSMPNTKGGDQRYLNTLNLNPDLMQELFPGKIISYKEYGCMHAVPDGVAIVCMHGLPRPHQAGGWARKVWQGAA
jgi:hypothetical protein